MDKTRKEEIQDIIKRLEMLGETMHPHDARHIDAAVLELEYYLID